MRAAAALGALALALGAAGTSLGACTTAVGGGPDGAADAAPEAAADAGPATATNIKHLVVVIQENHTFDTYFGRWCTAPAGSKPTCTTGPACCEAGPDKEPAGASPVVLDDAENGSFDPNHGQACELTEVNGGKMDQFVTGPCGDPKNFAYAAPSSVATYVDLASKGALADRYFQPVVGASEANDLYFARASFVFADNSRVPNAIGKACYPPNVVLGEYTEPTIADLLVAAGVSWGFYAEGYKALKDANGTCPAPDPKCPVTQVSGYPCAYDPGDVPFAFFPSVRDTDAMRDYARFSADLGAGALPSVSFVKAIGYRTEHPGANITISAGMAFVKGVADAIAASAYAKDTLLLVTFDEGGGFFDHVPPPATNPADNHPYGTRVPMIAVGRFARKGAVSHVVMEHSSVVRFIEHNWLGATGQLGTRDVNVANIGSLLDPAETGAPVPEQ